MGRWFRIFRPGRWGVLLLLLLGVASPTEAMAVAPVLIIFDTDISSDIDDALALALLHELVDRGEARLLAVTISKDDPWIAPFVDVVNTFYGRPDIPVGVVKNGRPPWRSAYVRPVAERQGDGRMVYPHDLARGDDAPDATALLREILAAQPDTSVVIVSVGVATNLARLLASNADRHSWLSGIALVRQKVRWLSWMAGQYGGTPRKPEANAIKDLAATRTVLSDWPTPVMASGWEVGAAIRYPGRSIARDFDYVRYHPIADAYRHYRDMPYDRPTWDLTSVLIAVRPDDGYFGYSERGRISIDRQRLTWFAEDPDGPHRYVTVTREQALRVRTLFVAMVSSPPGR